MKDENKVFILKRNGSIDFFNESDIDNVSVSDVAYILIPLKRYDGFTYIPVLTENLAKPCKLSIYSTAILHEYEYRDDFGKSMSSFTEIKPIHLTSETTADFYRVIASIYAFNAINDILNIESYDGFTLFGLYNTVTDIIYGNYRIHDDIRNSKYKTPIPPGDSADGVAYYLSHLSKLLSITYNGNINPKPPDLLASLNVDKNIVISDNHWTYMKYVGESDPDSIIMINMRLFGILTAVPRIDLDLIEKFYNYKIYYSAYSDVSGEDKYVGEISVDIIEECTEYFDEVYVNEMNLYDPFFTIEVLTQFKYIALSLWQYVTAIYGTYVTDMVFTIMASYRPDANRAAYDEFTFSLTYSKLDSITDVYSEVLRELILFLKSKE